MKKRSTKSTSKKQVRRKRSTRRADEAPIDEVISFQAGIREALVSQIRDAVTAMAEDLCSPKLKSCWERAGLASRIPLCGAAGTPIADLRRW